MGTVAYLAAEIELGLRRVHPRLRKTVVKKIAPTIAAVIQTQSANTAAWATVLPIETERADHAAAVDCAVAGQSAARQPVRHGAVRPAATGIGGGKRTDPRAEHGPDRPRDRFAILMLSLRVGDRALPLLWSVEAGAANLGFEAQRARLEIRPEWLPGQGSVLLAAERFYRSSALLGWLQVRGWGHRLRLKGDPVVDVGCADITCTAELARGVSHRYETGARLLEPGVATNIGVLHETGHEEPWIVAMDCPPNAATVRDWGLRWGIEPMFSDFKRRGFGLEDTRLRYAERLDHLVLIMTLALYGCLESGCRDALDSPTALEKKNRRADRPRPQELAQTSALLPLLVSTGLKKGRFQVPSATVEETELDSRD